MAKSELSIRALKLRQSGASIGQIARTLNVSKSSASLWCRNVQLTPTQANLIREKAIRAGHAGRLLGAEANRTKKLNAIAEYTENGKVITAHLTDREILLVGAAIYWGEGSKVGQLSFVNTDKDMVLFMFRWFQVALNVKKVEFMPRIYINEQHIRRRKQIEKYWSLLLSMPLSQFSRTVFIRRPQRKKYINHSNYYGLLSLRIRRSTHMKYRILGLIEGLKCSSF